MSDEKCVLILRPSLYNLAVFMSLPIVTLILFVLSAKKHYQIYHNTGVGNNGIQIYLNLAILITTIFIFCIIAFRKLTIYNTSIVYKKIFSTKSFDLLSIKSFKFFTNFGKGSSFLKITDEHEVMYLYTTTFSFEQLSEVQRFLEKNALALKSKHDFDPV